jgi:hypothetical protein
MLGATLVASYGILLWITAGDHRASFSRASSAPTSVPASPPLATESPPIQLSAQESVELPPEATLQPAAQDQPVEDEVLAAEESDDATSVMQTAPLIEPLHQRSLPSSDPAAISALSQAIRQSSDREVRLAAVNSLLLIGRKSSVDPAVVTALRDAAKDADDTVSAQAVSALAEVERVTH